MGVDDDKRGAGVRFPPPLIFLTAMLLGYGVEMLWPWGSGDFTGRSLLALLLLGSALLLVIAASVSLFLAKTSIEPWKPTSQIVTSGIFAYSRNPIYLAFCIATLGIGLFINSLWVMLSVMPAAWGVYRVAISKEERYLEAKFGPAYQDYKARVRRWL